MPPVVLTPQQRRDVLDAIKQKVQSLQDPRHPGPPLNMGLVEDRLDQLAEIAQRMETDREEPYLAAVLDEICPTCPQQYACGHCSLRTLDACALYKYAQPILTAIAQALPPAPHPDTSTIPTWPPRPGYGM